MLPITDEQLNRINRRAIAIAQKSYAITDRPVDTAIRAALVQANVTILYQDAIATGGYPSEKTDG